MEKFEFKKYGNTIKGDFPFIKYKTYGVYKKGDSFFVRNYKRVLKNGKGMNMIEAYAYLIPFQYSKSIFSVK